MRLRARLLLETLTGKDPREEQAERIRNSRLSATEKGRRLKALIEPGMSRDAVERLLGGSGVVSLEWARTAGFIWEENYPAYELWVGYQQNQLLYLSQHDDW